MAEQDRIVIDASQLDGFNYLTYFADYFKNDQGEVLGNGTRKFYGDVSSGMYGYVTGDQVGINWGGSAKPTAGAKYVLIEGNDFAYDGAQNMGHGYSGTVNTVTFGSVGTGTVIPDDTPATGQPRDLVSGVVPGLVISNIDVSMEVGKGLNGVDPDLDGFNEVYAFLTLIRDAGKVDQHENYVKLLYKVLGTHAQQFIGTDGDDSYTGTAFDDLIETGAGNDLIVGGGGNDTIDGGDGDNDVVVYDGAWGDGYWSHTGGVNGAPLVVTDSRGTGGTGVDTLTNVEYLRFTDLTYDAKNIRVNFVPTDITLDDADVEGDAAAGTVVGTLTVDDELNNGRGGPSADTHTLSLVDDAGGQFEIVGTQIRVKGDLMAGSHTVRVKVVDGIGHVLEKDLTITVSNVAPEITANEGGATAWAEVAENTAVVTTVTAHDANFGTTLTYSLEGADKDLFTIDADGVLSFKSAPDFENAQDAGKNNVYDVTVKVSDGELSDTQALKIEVTDVNDNAPVITSGASVTVAENKTAVTTVAASDADTGATLTYELDGADKNLFAIDANGVLSFKSAPDFEKPKDAGKDNVYDVTVKVSDGTFSTTQALQVAVTDVNDNAPRITSNGGGDTATVKVAENKTAVTTVKASDADAGAKLTYSLAGADHKLFAIDAKTGALSFKAAPDFEAPKDAGKDNVYDVTVKVSDGSLTDTQTLKIAVTDVKGKTFNGTAKADTLNGTVEADTLNGGAGNDTLKGGAGNDKLHGGAGADKLYGEAGADHFIFRFAGESTVKAAGRDTIFDFDGKGGDRIDLSGFDANSVSKGMQDFSFIGTKAFSGKAGELRYETSKSGSDVYADTNGDGKADFAIHFDDVISFQKGYFLL